jgi:hypothetical protein
MSSIWEKAAAALATLTPLPVSEGQKLVASGAELPDAFATFFLVTSASVLDADDVEKLRIYTIQVSYFNRAGLAAVPDIAGAMVAAGFTRGPEREIPYDQVTRHYGLAADYNYFEE